MEGVLGLDVPRCHVGQHGGPGQHHDVGTGACAWTCALQAWSLLVQTCPMRPGFQLRPPTPSSLQTKPQITRSSLIPPLHIYAALPLLSEVFSRAVKNLMLNTEAKKKRVRASGEELRIPAVCGASCSPAPVLGYTVCVTQLGRVRTGRGQK